MQEYKVPEFTVMSLSTQQIEISQESDNNQGAGSICGPNIGNGN